MLDEALWYYGKVQDTSKLSIKKWAEKIMVIHFFRKQEEIEAKNLVGQ